jgi:hypothetical protein
MSGEDLPMISLSGDSTQINLTPQKEAHVAAPEPTRQPVKPAAAPAAPAAQADPRKASEARKPGTVSPASARPANDASSASRPGGPAVRPAPAPAASPGEDEDPEKLLREYADRQKTKLVRLELQLVESKKIASERDALKAKVDALSKELQDARRQLEASAKSEEMIKDLQGKVDAAILSNSILSEDKEKLKKALSQQTEFLKKAEDRGAQAEKSLAEVEQELAEASGAREAAEAKVAAALSALQGATAAAPAPKPAPEKPAAEAAPRPTPAPAPAAKAAAEEKPAASKPPAVKPATAPGRFSFLKK